MDGIVPYLYNLQIYYLFLEKQPFCIKKLCNFAITMETKRQQKISKLIQKELSEIFQREIKTLGNIMITVTKVNVTSDMSYARVYLSVFGPDKETKTAVVKEVNTMSKSIRGKLGDRIKLQVRVIPELQFFEDDSLDYIENIDNLLKS